MGQISRFLVPMGYALKVIVEMEDLTAGTHQIGLLWSGAPNVAETEHLGHRRFFPTRTVEEFDKRFEVYPLLVYPIRIYDHGENQGLQPKPRQLRSGKRWDMFDHRLYRRMREKLGAVGHSRRSGIRFGCSRS